MLHCKMFKGKVCNFKVICNPHVRLARKDLRTHAHVKRTHVRGARRHGKCCKFMMMRPKWLRAPRLQSWMWICMQWKLMHCKEMHYM